MRPFSSSLSARHLAHCRKINTELWTHTSQIIDALLLEVQHRPAILLYVPSSMAANNGKSQLGTQDRPQPAIQSAGDLLLAPWLTANLLRVIGSLSSITSESLAPAIQQATLDKLRETVALIVTAVDAQYAAEEVDALAVLSHMVDGLFVLLQGERAHALQSLSTAFLNGCMTTSDGASSN